MNCVYIVQKNNKSHYFGKGVDGLDPGDPKLEVDEEKSNFKEFGDDSLLLIVEDQAPSPLSSDLLEDGLVEEIGSELTSSSNFRSVGPIITSLMSKLLSRSLILSQLPGLFQTSEKLYVLVFVFPGKKYSAESYSRER